MKTYKFRKPGLDRTERILEAFENLPGVIIPWLLVVFAMMMIMQCWRSV